MVSRRNPPCLHPAGDRRRDVAVLEPDSQRGLGVAPGHPDRAVSAVGSPSGFDRSGATADARGPAARAAAGCRVAAGGAVGHHGRAPACGGRLQCSPVPGSAGQTPVVGNGWPAAVSVLSGAVRGIPDPHIAGYHHGSGPPRFGYSRNPRVYRRLCHRNPARNVLHRRGVCRASVSDRLPGVRLSVCADDVSQPGAARCVHPGLCAGSDFRQRFARDWNRIAGLSAGQCAGGGDGSCAVWLDILFAGDPAVDRAGPAIPAG
ncbi:hypothetical protein GALL_535960 [mine drainage metagenome]|uniref:Uncharacterized protein n=1 Tax=mine drainage metagenome TaxID=410659 RepID=A0A1J5PMQ4_9ZZZZ